MTISLLEKLNERASIEVEVYKLIFTYRKNLIHFTFIFFSYNCFLKNLFTRGLKVFVYIWCASGQWLVHFVNVFKFWITMWHYSFVGAALSLVHLWEQLWPLHASQEQLWLQGVGSTCTLVAWFLLDCPSFSGCTLLLPSLEAQQLSLSLRSVAGIIPFYVKLSWGSLIYFLSLKLQKDFLHGVYFNAVAVVLWAFGVCRLHCSRHPRNSWEGTLGRSGLCKACLDLVYRFGCSFCPDSCYYGEFDC